MNLLRQVQQAEAHGDAHGKDCRVETPPRQQTEARGDADELKRAHAPAFALAAQELARHAHDLVHRIAVAVLIQHAE